MKDLPLMPEDLDNAIYQAMLDAVGGTLAFRATDAVWRVLCEWCFFNTTSDTVREFMEAPDA